MPLRLYNTKTRSLEIFEPLDTSRVTMYACGPTVYDYTHIGHMRKYIGDDILKRTLRYLGYQVTHVMNITDVGHLVNDVDESGEDKLEKGARREGKTVWEIAQFYTDYFHTTMEAVNVLPPTHETKATDHIKEMIALIETLLAKGFAYETAAAIYFEVSKDTAYGKLSGQKLSEKEQAVRDEVVIDPDKKNPADFSLWFKRAGKFADHQMHWPSPWGDGFPGWHIECSAMSMEYLGETIDIHTGGIEHIPVHHENEIAQSECATGKEFVRFWIHYEMLLVDGVKMSKSLKNFFTIEDIHSRKINPLAVRLMVMQTSYRKPLNFTWDSLLAAEQSLKKIQKFVAKAKTENKTGTVVKTYTDQVREALENDVNTASLLAIVWQLIDDQSLTLSNRLATLLDFDQVLGLNLANTPAFTISPEAATLVSARDQARLEKEYQKSDELRAALQKLGYEVIDTADGTELS